MTRLTFLGTGGGRFVTLTQERSTGGMYLEDDYKVHIDPGPGALSAMRRNRIDPLRTDGILISHCHPDHYSNAEPIMEGIGLGRKGRWGFLIGPISVTKGKGGIGPAVSRYHRSRIKSTITVKPGDDFNVYHLKGRATPSVHSDPFGVGFRIRTRNGVLSYIADTELTDDVVESHLGARILIMAVTRPLGASIPNHLSTEDAAKIASRIGPELCLLTHQGKKFINEGPAEQSEYVEEHSGIRTIAAEDDMIVSFKEGIDVFSSKKSRSVPV
ncbi:MAG: MBL fold metallo-hydrolase [Candidatus Thermoplasmatota archaeon]|nr:MBL fold metallo-hydrolase [Candidatus Thermoplasmatota archaeon]